MKGERRKVERDLESSFSSKNEGLPLNLTHIRIACLGTAIFMVMSLPSKPHTISTPYPSRIKKSQRHNHRPSTNHQVVCYADLLSCSSRNQPTSYFQNKHVSANNPASKPSPPHQCSCRAALSPRQSIRDRMLQEQNRKLPPRHRNRSL